MKATEAKLLAFLQKSPQFVIPIYQRIYSWTEKQCRQLWDDILRAGSSDTIAVHFHRLDRVRRVRTSAATSCPSSRSRTRRHVASARIASPACLSRPGATLRSWRGFADHEQRVLRESDLHYDASLGRREHPGAREGMK